MSLILAAVLALSALNGAPDQRAAGHDADVVARSGAPLSAVGSVQLGGVATWFDAAQGTAAAGPALRNALGSDWRGSIVTVCADGCVTVRLTDWCACGDRNGKDTLIDLDRRDFARIAPLSAGVVAVTVGFRAIPLPATDTAEPWMWAQVHEVVM